MKTGLARLKRRSEFVRVANRGRRWATTGVVVQVLCTPADHSGREGDIRAAVLRVSRAAERREAIRYGITASRRVGHAVARNRVRRRLRAVAEEILPLYGRRGCDYVLIGRANTVDRPFPALIEDVTVALKRLKVYRPSPSRSREAVAADTDRAQTST